MTLIDQIHLKFWKNIKSKFTMNIMEFSLRNEDDLTANSNQFISLQCKDSLSGRPIVIEVILIMELMVFLF